MCKDYCCSAFLHFQDVIDPSVICDLDNNINPIFRPKNVSDEDYARAAPALRLASRALLTDAATKYLLTMSEGDIFLDGKTAKSKKALVKGRQVSWSEVDQLERVLKRHTDGKYYHELKTLLKYPRSDHRGKVTHALKGWATHC